MPVTVLAVGSGCNNMKGCIFDKWCWSAGTRSCTLAGVDYVGISSESLSEPLSHWFVFGFNVRMMRRLIRLSQILLKKYIFTGSGLLLNRSIVKWINQTVYSVEITTHYTGTQRRMSVIDVIIYMLVPDNDFVCMIPNISWFKLQLFSKRTDVLYQNLFARFFMNNYI